MTNENVFALRNSGLSDFLFSDVGTELNGSELTMLSILARLGLDPWAEAARLAKLPRKEALDSVIRSIGPMASGMQEVARLATAASRLILLLPKPTQNTAQGILEEAGLLNLRQSWPIALLCASLALGVAINMMSMPASDGRGAAGAPAPAAVHSAALDAKQPKVN